MIKENEFRILELFPHGEDWGGPIICSLAVAAITDHPEYEALSYAWGNQSETEGIDVLDTTTNTTRRVEVTKIVLNVLRQLRFKEGSRKLWIDQLCINQHDPQERMRQVRLMRQIYSQCSRGILYLGDLPEGISRADAENAFAMWRYMAAWGQTPKEKRNELPKPTCLASEPALRGALKALYATDSRFNSWWSRIWTVQETVLPKRKMLKWGHVRLHWFEMRQAQQTWTQTGMPPDLQDAINKCYEWLGMPRHEERLIGQTIVASIWLDDTERGESPLLTMFKWHARQATEPRDKIFGLLGLSPPGSFALTKTCGYHTPLPQVLASATLDFITTDGNLMTFAVNFRSAFHAKVERRPRMPGVPQWALNVIDGITPRHPNGYNEVHGYASHNAHNGIPLDVAALAANADRAVRGEGLLMKGVLADTVKITGNPLSSSDELLNQARSDGNDTLILEAIRGWLKLAEDLRASEDASTPQEEQQQRRRYIRDVSVRQAFAQLLLGELVRDEEGWPKRRPTETDCEAVLQFVATGCRSGALSHHTLKWMVITRVFFVTESGLIGLGQMDMRPGDEVCVLHGGNVPFAVRERKEEEDGRLRGHYFVGPCHVRGIMRGEAFREEGNVVEDIILY